LAFHDVLDTQRDSFREQLRIVKSVANVVTLEDVVTGKLSSERINVAITFDDGFQGWVEHASPILKEFGMNATFFVSSGLIGLRGEDEREFLENKLMSSQYSNGRLITADALRRLAEQGFCIGGHTCNHINLGEIRDLAGILAEIQKDKHNLEKITGTTINFFAYPFGVYKNKYFDMVSLLEDSGYKGAVTLVPGFITGRTNRFVLGRDLVNPSMSPSVFKARMMGNYDPVMYTRKLLQLPKIATTS
jgi:peptidoglycan/xylan/chitin deacetylase (PgdA/CDA1 family)